LVVLLLLGLQGKCLGRKVAQLRDAAAAAGSGIGEGFSMLCVAT
jgi:hypothetical protein